MEKAEKVKQGKKNKRTGREFEMKVRKDMEAKGWTICKWSNNIEFPESNINLPAEERVGKIVPAKHVFNPFGRCMVQGTGFPDFVAIRPVMISNTGIMSYEVIGLEAKSAKYLDRLEKEKCAVYLANKTFSRIVIASKCAEGIKYANFGQ